jgi:hypothetical protein
MQETEEQGAWRALETQLFRRWELLAVCYAKIGEKKVSHYITVHSNFDVYILLDGLRVVC